MLDAGGGGGGIVTAVKNFSSMAKAGSFAVNETGGQALLDAIHEMRDWIDGEARNLVRLKQPAPLGSSDGAETMRPYLQEVAGDHQGFVTMLEEFHVSLDEAEQGIKAAMASYQETDGGIGGRFTQV